MSARECIRAACIVAAFASAVASAGIAVAMEPDGSLAPHAIADGVWVIEGRREHFTRANGGDIVNTGIIATRDGAVVIDTGPSKRYGDAQRAAVRAVTGGDVARVYVTHAHPDHFLGGQAYADVPMQALPGTAAAIAANGETLTQNLYLLVGDAMYGTVPVTPRGDVTAGEVDIGGRRLRLIALSGHTTSDLVVFDVDSGVLFAGDLVFFDRAATTPDADIDVWLGALDALQLLPFRVLVPGHGPPVRDASAIAQTRDYLQWLRTTLQDAAARGLDINEAMAIAAPERFRRLAVLEAEWRRSVMHLYPAIEADSLPVR